ncbi:hypothetical protein DSM112329_02150 [Paraconexibacter sp. AEG42_29]|uniref:Type II secretion system protein GspF domain-containing protein n=1 Tax=Paraconexibacter sp. AEG42_29 TaxID=2997339 RepID=A0AAU7AUI8_9ACTN
MTGAAVAAGLAGGAAVLAAWEGLGLLEASRLSATVRSGLRPLRSAAGGAHDVTAAERRRLIVLLAATLGAGGLLLGGLLPALIAATSGPWITGWALAGRRARWRRGMADGAAAAARAIADALAGGHSVRGAIADAAAAGGAGRAVDGELRRAQGALALGAPTDEVLDHLRARAAGPAWDTLVAAMLLQRDAGGDLASLLRELAAELDVARRAEADARAATAQARFTAMTVAGLPLLAAVLAELGAPGTFAGIAAHPLGRVLAVGAVLLQVGGMLTVRRLARTEVG